MKTNAKFFAACIFAFLFLGLIFLLKTVDVAPIGPDGSLVGLSGLNSAARQLLPSYDRWDTLSDLLLIASIGAGGCYGLLGLMQLLRTRSLLKVRPTILLLGGMYVAAIALYVLFEKCPVNFRPVLEDGLPAASFPSSHTMLTLTFLGGAALSLPELTPNLRLQKTARVLCILCMVLIVVARVLSGQHWVTDILGGILVSSAMLFLFSGLQDRLS